MKAVYISVLTYFIFYSFLGFSSALVEEASKKLLPPTEKKLFTTIVEERQERFTARKKERASLLAADREFNSTITATIEQLKNNITSFEQALKATPENEFIKQKLEATLERFGLLNDLKYSRAQVIALIDELNKADQEYLADPELKKYAQSFLSKDPKEFTFDNLIAIHELIIAHEKDSLVLAEQESNASSELENRRRAAKATAEFSTVKKEKENEAHRMELNGFTAKQKEELHELHTLVDTDRKALDAMRITESEYKLMLIKTRLFNVRHQLETLKAVLRIVKPLTKISDADVSFALEELDKKKQQAFSIKEQYRLEIEKLAIEQKTKERELDALSKRFNIPLGVPIDEWAKDPKPTVSSFMAFAKIGTLNDETLLLRRKRELLEAELALEEEKLRNEALRINVKESFFKMLGQRFATEDALTQEIKKYSIPRDENKANLALYKERQNTVTSFIALQKKALENLGNRIANAELDKNTIFKDASSDYEQYIALLKHAQTKVQEQLDLLNKVASVYTDIIARITNASKHLDFINSELSSITIWYRPEHAISWEGIKNSLPDIQAFVKDVGEYVNAIHVSTVWAKLKEFLISPWRILFFLFQLILVFLAVLVVKIYLPVITEKLVSVERAPVGVRWMSILTAVFLGFGIKHLVSIVIWATFFIVLMAHPLTDAYVYIIFYLVSIPYLMYLANRWMRYLVYFNEKYNYCFLSKDYQDRFVIVISTLAYATIAIVFFREAFILGNYHRSELPTILLAFNFIIFQIAAILLLAKDQILSLISTRTEIGRWIYEQVDSYYYFIQFLLIAVIVMSNPYVGFGRLVLFILKRLLYTAILLQLIIWIHEWFKRFSSRIFFYFDTDEEIARDRFSYAKTWYGILVVLIFATFTFIGLLIAARIWHWPEALIKIQNWADVVRWIKTPILLQDTKSPVSLSTILTILGFVFAGSIVAFAINRFVLGRIFDILLVESGVQNTIASLIRYLIIITAIIVGFESVNLGDLVWYLIAALIFGIGWVIKDPASDLIAYFIIIVQRPVKVGDYIVLDENTNGVVRRITPRSVEIRRKNSTTLVIPNVQVTNRIVTNWNHSRGFIAFDDILLTIPYKVDPGQVREILLKVLDESRVVLKNPRPVVRLESFSDLGFVFMVRGYLSSNHTLDMWDIASDIRFAIVKRLRDSNIDIAYPVRIVVSNSGEFDSKKELL